MWSNARSEAALLAELPAPIEIRPVRGARRLRLRYDEVRGVLKLTCPVRTSRRSALSWAIDQREWIEAQLARARPAEPFEPGAVIPIAGRDTKLVWAEKQPRAPRLDRGELRCGGPRTGFERRIESFLKRLALDTMSREAAEFADAAGVTVKSVSVGDAGSRWGSCSSEARIRLSWRLILAPPEARRHVVSHEVAHIAHLNHGPEFRALEAQLFGPGLSGAKAALRRVGPRLRRLGARR
ncbi:MAG TPA: YgjP-like metallopeptidase domain-containing protein [Sphingomicrobium sp.]